MTSIFETLTSPSDQDLTTLSDLIGCDVEGITGTETGSLAGGDCTLPSDGSLVDYHAFRLTSESQIRITLSSDAFEPYLLILDGEAGLIDQAGAEPGDDAVEIDDLLDEGLFVIAATSRDAGETGRYTLRVERR